ncbi:MAG: hypothetical protein AB1757_10705 [Acidobacteriota bacterium]
MAKKEFKINGRNKRTALRLLFVITALLIQQTSASAFYLCDSFLNSTVKKGNCRCCPPEKSTDFSKAHDRMGAMKNAHCKAISKTSSHQPNAVSLNETAKISRLIQVDEPFSIPRVCCQVEKPKTQPISLRVPLQTEDDVATPPAEISSSYQGSTLPIAANYYPRTRPVYLVLSIFLI